jgi:multidrug efflux pump subunit AcrA (membrane-fusion protein)
MSHTYGSYDAATGAYTAQTRDQFHASLTADIERALDAFLGSEPKSLREIQAEEEAAAAAKLAERERAMADKRAADERAAQEKAAAAAAAEAELQRHRDLGHTPCWLCKRDKGIEAYHPCKEKTCPQAPIAYTRFDRWGYPNTAYPAHPLREYYSAPGMPSHSNNYYKRAFREYDEEQARLRQHEARALKEAEDATGLKGDAAKAEYVRRRQAPPQHGLADFLDVSGDQPKPPAKKGPKKPTVEKFSLDDV